MLTLFYTILVIEPRDLSTLGKHSTKIAAAVAPSDVLLRHPFILASMFCWTYVRDLQFKVLSYVDMG